jgi:hypothetical protein
MDASMEDLAKKEQQSPLLVSQLSELSHHAALLGNLGSLSHHALSNFDSFPVPPKGTNVRKFSSVHNTFYIHTNFIFYR